MSHVVSIQTKITDAAALNAACARLGLSPPVEGEAKLFAESVCGLVVKLPGWLYPAVVDTASGTVKCDTYNGHWGSQAELDKLLQVYAVEKTRIEARRAGHTVSEQILADGSIRLTIAVAGGAR